MLLNLRIFIENADLKNCCRYFSRTTVGENDRVQSIPFISVQSSSKECYNALLTSFQMYMCPT